VTIQCDFGKNEELIWEDNQVKRYTESEQYRKDKKIKTLEEQNRELREENDMRNLSFYRLRLIHIFCTTLWTI
jgi:hypothetical protein